MKKQTITFRIKSSLGEVKNIERSTILQPKVRYTGKGTKWFDDSTLHKKKEYEDDE